MLPWHEQKIRIRALIAHEPLSVRQRTVQDTRHPMDLIAVPLNGQGLRLGVVLTFKPPQLAVVGSLARHLEMQPLLGEVAPREGLIAEAVLLRIVSVNEVLDNGATLPQRQIGVKVGQGRESAIGVDGRVGFLLDGREIHKGRGVGDVQGLEDDGHFL